MRGSLFVLASAQANNLKYINILIGQKTSVTLTTQQFEQTQGNEEAIRAKKSAMEELRSKPQKGDAVKPGAPPVKVPASSPRKEPAAYSESSIKSGPTKSGYASPPREQTVSSAGYTVVDEKPGSVRAKAEAKSAPKKPSAYSDANIKSAPMASAYSSPSEKERVDSGGYTVVSETPPKKN